MTKFVGLRPKTYSYLIDDSSEDKKVKSTKKCVIKTKLQFESYKNCLESIQLDVKTQTVSKKYKKVIRNNKSILKTHQRFKNEKHSVFAEEINKISLSSNDDKRMQSFDSTEAYPYGTSKDLVSEKEEIKCKNIIKLYKK